MAYTRTLAQLRQSFLVRGQYENSGDITPSVANELLNDALVESQNLIVQRWDDYYTVVSTSWVTVAGTQSYALPSDFYKLRKVEVLFSGQATDPNACWQRVYPVSVDDTHRRHILIAKRYKYRAALGQLLLYPCPEVVETVRVYYIALPPQLVLDTDTVEFDTPIEQKLVLHIALRDAYQRQDLPTQEIEAKIAQLVSQVRTNSDHDAGEPFYLGSRTDAGEWDYE